MNGFVNYTYLIYVHYFHYGDKKVLNCTYMYAIEVRISSGLKWQWAGHVSCRIDNHWRKRVLEKRTRLGERSVERP
jgi:hypothetical protein